jgi:pimeloyl-ACP methyl ester carboxylesterase
MHTTAPDGTEIHYDVTGSGPAVVLIHGITDSSADWAPIDERLAVDHTVVTLDLRGHGQSGDAADYSPLTMAADLAAVVEAAGVAAPLMIGHSLGAVVATAYAAGAPTTGVIAIDQTLRFSDFAGAVRQLEHQLRGSGFHAALRAIFNQLDGPLLPDHLRVRLAANRDGARPEVVLGVWDLLFSATDDELDAMVAAMAPALTMPLLAIHGSDPGDGYPAWLRAQVPHAQFELWADHGHYPHLVDPDRFLARVAEIEAVA